MKRILLVLTGLLPILSIAQSNQRREIPYFQCQVPDRSGISYLPLQDYSVDVKIAGIIADVQLKQTFVNSFNTPLEVTYVFPGSVNSAVYGLEMKIGERTVVANIEKRNEARQIYQTAVQDGHRASLLEQVRPNVYQMMVGNIMPQDTIEVLLKYTEYVENQDDTYQLLVPTTIGDRYSGENRRRESMPVDPAYITGSRSPYPLHISVNLASPVPINQVNSNTHKIDLNVLDQNHWKIDLNPSETYAANRDFILNYRLRGDNPKSGLLLHEGEQENFFMLQIQPPKSVAINKVPPREYLFVVDVSGSMQGFPMSIAKDLMVELLEDLRPNDIFNVILFEFGDSQLFGSSQLATTNNIKKASRFMRTRMAGGGTNMASALRNVYRSIDDSPTSRSVILITDGHIEAEKKVFQEIRNNLYKVNVFAFGIGPSVNHYLIKNVASAGMGEEFIVTDPAFASKQATALTSYIKRPALTNILIDFQGNDDYDLSPTSLQDVLSGRPLTVFGKYRGDFTDAISVSGYSGQETYQETIVPPSIKYQNPALTYLWARNRLKDMELFGIEGLDQKYAMTNIGLKYHLLTKYTSFVAVDSEVANISNQLASMKQPLAKPFNPTPSNFQYALRPGAARSRVNATGAVSRAAGYSEINVFLPPQTKVSAPVTLIRWQNNGSDPENYTVTVENIYNEELLRIETKDDHFWLNFEELNDNSNFKGYLIKISNGVDSVNEIGVKLINGAGSNYRDLYNLNFTFTLEEYLTAISDLERQDLHVDALTLAEIALTLYPKDEELREIHEMIWYKLDLY